MLIAQRFHRPGIYLVCAVLLLSVGTCLYLIRPVRPAIFAPLLPEPIGFRIAIGAPEWIMYHLPDSLWLASFLCLMKAIWNDASKTCYRYWTFALFVIGVGSEGLQQLHFIAGTGDILDVAAYSATFIAFLLLTERRFRNFSFASSLPPHRRNTFNRLFSSISTNNYPEQ